jgi:hypothetical protein
MDHLFLMTMAVTGLLGWLWAAMRKGCSGLVRWFWTPLAVAWLAVYFAFELFRSQPEVYSGTAEASIWTCLFIAGGIIVLLGKPKAHTPSGGVRSA